MVEQGKAKSTDLYDIVTNRKFSGGLPDRVGRKLASILKESLTIFSDKQQRFLNSTESPVPMHLARSDDEEEEEEKPAAKVEVKAPAKIAEDTAPATATLRSITLEEGDKALKKDKTKPKPVEENKGRAAEDKEAEDKRRKLEEEADNILGALVPGLADDAPPIFSKADARRSASRSRGSRSISSRTARRLAREKRKGRERDGSWRSAGSGLSGSRALLLNRNYTEDLPHMPRNAATTANSYGPDRAERERPERAERRSRSRSRRRRR
ncbi:unnamed protein product [Effrenium voratum]|uniref:Uncharacterized protein n=1 Tax=Effrenium voratum TaxID=2562239 RepID=A0AA36ILD3_9DINO|nr:unnamed protein product [Effrenium voratum]